MKGETASRIPGVLKKYEQELLNDWLRLQVATVSRRADLLSEPELRRESAEFLTALRDACQAGCAVNLDNSTWRSVREILDSISRSRGRQGFTPVETAMFVFSFKQPLTERLRAEIGEDGAALARETWTANVMLDQLGLFTTEVHQKAREEVIRRQQQELLELSTPVVRLWTGVLALPLIGTLDSARTQVVMESLLKQIMDTGSEIAIIDITGVPMVDTLVAQHLLKTVAAARLMGADCIISGIRPQIAQTIVHLGVELTNVVTKATLADAFRLALERTGQAVVDVAKQA